MSVPHEYSPEERERIANYVCAELAKGRSMRKIFEEDGRREKLCDRAVFSTWRNQSDSLHDQIARARGEGLEAILEEIIEIGDDKDEDPQSRRVRIYARETLAAKLAPALYGNRVDVTSGGKPLPAPQSVTLVDNRIQSVLMLVQDRKKLDEQLRGLLE
jgi:hypothetical protein